MRYLPFPSLIRSILLIIPCVANLLYMHWMIAPLYTLVSNVSQLYIPISHALIDIFVILIVFQLLCYKKEILPYRLTFYFTLLWTIVNVVYARFFGTYFQLNAIGEIGNLDGLWSRYISSSFQWIDISLIINVIVFTWIEKETRLWSSRMLIHNSIILVVLFVQIEFFNFYHNEPVFSLSGQFKSFERTLALSRVGDINTKYWMNGIIFSQFGYYIYSELTEYKLSEMDKAAIDDFITSNKYRYNAPANLGKNLEIIICESFLSEASNISIEGEEITPYLNSLKRKSGTYWNDSVVSNIQIGESSDGQLITLTGLLPLANEVTIAKLIKNKLYSIPQELKQRGYHTSMVIPTQANLWHQADACVAYGIDTLLSVEGKDNLENDSTTLEKSSRFLRTITQPFFHCVLTLSTHSTYDLLPDYINPLVLNFPESYSKEYINYLSECRYMDRAIGRHVQELQSAGLWDNTIIIVVSDHEAHAKFLNMPLDAINNEYIPFYIVNANIDDALSYKYEMNQIDIYPTLLNLMGINSFWSGIGSSVLDKNNYRNNNSDLARQISDFIIRSNYFEHE